MARASRGFGIFIVLTLLSCGPTVTSAQTSTSSLPIKVTPAPFSVAAVQDPTPVVVSQGETIVAPRGDQAALQVAKGLSDLVRKTRGLNLRVVVGEFPPAGVASIVLSRQSGFSDEAYSLDIEGGQVRVAATSDAGLFYGAVTLWQLLTPSAERGPIALAAMRIDDHPLFAWRGLMLDSARHFQSPAFIEALIDRMARAKLNVLQWHLTDDQAWRLEIKKYPRLTDVGAWRIPAGAAAAADIDPKTKAPRRIGGFYTQDQVREIVAYAAARHITIVPEIEMPGHAQAAIAALPALTSTTPPPTEPSSDWGVNPNIYNVDDKTFAILEDVLVEVMGLFPSKFIHVGGDEAVKFQWRANPDVQARMKSLWIGDEDALQGWFTGRIGQFLTAHGRKLIGWDEILLGGAPQGSAITSWRGVDGAFIAAKFGHDAVLSPAPVFYLDNRASASPLEPPGRGAVISLKDVYNFDPIPAGLNAADRTHILGLQANLWTEHMRTEERMSMMMFPRALALAEGAWTPAAHRSWSDFADRLPAELARERALGEVYDLVPMSVYGLASPQGAGARLTLAGAEGLGEIHYTLDGKPPTAASARYQTPIETAVPTTVRAAAFRSGEQLAPASEIRVDGISIRTRTSQELKLCTNKIALHLEGQAPIRGERARYLIDIMNPCWIFEAADLTNVKSIEAAVGQLPFNFQIGDDLKKIILHPPTTAQGELEVRQDSCTGPVVATLPLAPASLSFGPTVLKGPLTATAGLHDLCFTFTEKSVDPMWALGRVTLVASGAPVGR